jgi:hypothetical protein
MAARRSAPKVDRALIGSAGEHLDLSRLLTEASWLRQPQEVLAKPTSWSTSWMAVSPLSFR